MDTIQNDQEHTVQTAAEPTLPPAPVLRRSRDDRVVAGVAGGLGRYLGIDPVIIRIAFVLLTVFGGSGVLLYIVGVIAIPEETAGVVTAPPRAGGWPGGQSTAVLLGAILVAVGAMALVSRLVPSFDQFFGPALLIGAGVAVITLGGRR